MDIRQWPLDKIMQLPDCCFGRRWLVVSGRRIGEGTFDQWVVKMPVPDRVVLWSLRWSGYSGTAWGAWFKVALGDQEPATALEFDEFERLFKGDLDNTAFEGAMYLGDTSHGWMTMRMAIEMAGRRFVLHCMNTHPTAGLFMTWFFEVSSIPTEVPDWLISGAVRNQ